MKSLGTSSEIESGFSYDKEEKSTSELGLFAPLCDLHQGPTMSPVYTFPPSKSFSSTASILPSVGKEYFLSHCSFVNFSAHVVRKWESYVMGDLAKAPVFICHSPE